MIEFITGAYGNLSDTYKIIINASGFLFIAALGVYTAIFFMRVSAARLAARSSAIEEEIDNLLNDYLFSETEIQAKEALYKAYSCSESSALFRELLLQKIVTLQKNFSGNISDKIKELYLCAGLKKYSLKKLKSRDWAVCATGINELMQIEVTDAIPHLQKLAQSKNEIIRNHARMALLKINVRHGLDFLSDTGQNISEWEQINLLRVLSGYRFEDVPDFRKWLNSKDDSIIIFSLKLISYFKQSGAAETVTLLLNHKSEGVRIESIRALAAIEAFYASDVLKDIYNSEPHHVKLEILKALAVLGTPEDINFLKSQLNEYNYEINLNAARALISAGEEGVQELQILKVLAPRPVQDIIEHSLDARI